MSQHLTSFTAIRGIAPWLSSLKAWANLKIGRSPNQLFIWALEGPTVQTYFAAPQAEASKQVSMLSDLVLQKGGTVFPTNPIGKFDRAEDSNGLQWKGFPIVMPFVKSISNNAGEFVFGGFFQPDINLSPPPAALLEQMAPTNLVCYDWEITGLRSEEWVYLSQVVRVASSHAQMRIELPGERWLTSAARKLGNCGTVVKLTAPNQLTFIRNSGVGFTAIELHLLADWLESPQFPFGLHSFASAESEIQEGSGGNEEKTSHAPPPAQKPPK